MGGGPGVSWTPALYIGVELSARRVLRGRGGKGFAHMNAREALALLAADEVCSALPFGCDGAPCDARVFAEQAGLPLLDLTYDSRAVTPGALFVCKGAAFREEYLASAVARGAAAYLAQVPHACGVPGLVVRDVRRAMALLACAFFGNPSHMLPIVGVTGTKGKTTTTFYLDAVLRARHAAPSALVGGVVVDDGHTRHPSHNTTPEAIELQRILAAARDNGCDAVAMEVSSQALKYDRTLGTRFAAGVFTNIGEDHISPIEHPTFEDYFASKLRIFDQSDCAVVNLETDHAPEVLTAARRCSRLVRYSCGAASEAEVRLLARERVGEGCWRLRVATPRGEIAFPFHALGAFNVSNALAAVAAAEALGVDLGAVSRGLEHVRVPGRMECYDSPDGSVVGIVDYAHNGMSMEALLACAREEFPDREVTVVFGATGERGTHRRAGLGAAAGRLADRVILTEDDPGSVPVTDICAEVGAAVRAQGGSYEVVEDRACAVHEAVAKARRPAVVLLAGKGCETAIQRAEGVVPCKPDAQLFCEEVGIAFPGYADLTSEHGR